MVIAAQSESGKFALPLARTLFARLISQHQRTMRSPGVDEVHDLRVTIRRFTQVLRVFKACFPAKEAKRVRRALTKHMDLAGEVRNLDIAAGILGKSKAAEATLLRSRFLIRRRAAENALTAKLKRWTKRQVPSKWRRKLLLPSPGQTGATVKTIADTADAILPRLVQRFFAAGNHPDGTIPHPKQLHKLRLAAKKLRYTLEVFLPLRESVLRGRIDQLKKLQSRLGDINDLETVRDMVLSEDAGGKLSAELAKRRDKRIEELWTMWKAEFAGPGNLAEWKKDLFFAPPGTPRKPPARSESARGRIVDSSSAVR